MMADRRLLRGLYQRVADGTLTTSQRNLLIQMRHAAGEGLSDLAREYGISPQRAWQIVNGT
jgi:hypothetical protein